MGKTVGNKTMTGRQKRSNKTPGLKIGHAVDRRGAPKACSVMWVGKEILGKKVPLRLQWMLFE